MGYKFTTNVRAMKGNSHWALFLPCADKTLGNRSFAPAIIRSFLFAVQDFRGIIVIQFLQLFFGEIESVQRPMITEVVKSVEMLVGRFEDPESDLVRAGIQAHVGSINEPVLVFGDKGRGGPGDRGDLTVSGGNVGI